MIKKTAGISKISVLKLLIKLGAVILILLFVASPYRVSGNYMSPSMNDGDLVITSKLTSYETGSIVLYRNASGKLVLGRIAASGGQTVSYLEGGGYTVDGYLPYEKEYLDTADAPEEDPDPVTLGKNQYFILNDQRSDQDDSRTTGPVNKKQICGTVVSLFRFRNF